MKKSIYTVILALFSPALLALSGCADTHLNDVRGYIPKDAPAGEIPPFVAEQPPAPEVQTPAFIQKVLEEPVMPEQKLPPRQLTPAEEREKLLDAS